MDNFKVGDILTNNQGSNYTIVEYRNSRHVAIEFNDSYKHQVVVRAHALKTKNIRNPFYPTVQGIGYIGVGDFTSAKGSIGREAYVKWQSMLERCYSGKDKHLAYGDCSVHPEWHNFQNFARWCVNQKYYGAGYDIDKDILVTGNRVYSKDTCCLVPEEINAMVVGLRFIDAKNDIGVDYSEDTGKYVAKASVGKYQKYIGSYKTSEEARRAYIELKKRYFKNMVIVYKDKIEVNVARALWDWDVLDVSS